MTPAHCSLRRLRPALSLAAGLVLAWNLQVMADCKPFVIDLLMGEPVPFDAMREDLAKARIVYVGEFHTIERHHDLQTRILKTLAQDKLKPALGMEMFEESDQPVLDRWLGSEKDFATLREDLGKNRWTNLKDYAPLLLLARDLRVPVVGLNASAALVRKIARGGLESLTDSERNALPKDVGDVDPLNDRLLRLRLRVHRAFQKKSLDRVVLAQGVRDATMARAVVRFLGSPRGQGRTMMVIAGSGHLNYGFGIPRRVKKIRNYAHRIVLASESGELVLSEEEKRSSVPVEITHEDLSFIRLPIADYLQMIPLKKEESPPARNEEQSSAIEASVRQ